MSTQWGLMLFSVNKSFKFDNIIPMFVQKSVTGAVREYAAVMVVTRALASHVIRTRKRSSNPPLQKTRSCENLAECRI